MGGGVMQWGLRWALMGAVSVAASAARADTPAGGPFGLGVIVGEPSGLSARYWMDHAQAADFALAYSFDDYFLVLADYKYNFGALLANSGQHFHPYLGAGLELAFSTSDAGNGRRFRDGNRDVGFGMGLRIPFGIEWMIPRAPLGVFVEIAPGIGVIPSTSGFVDAGLGIRYFF